MTDSNPFPTLPPPPPPSQPTQPFGSAPYGSTPYGSSPYGTSPYGFGASQTPTRSGMAVAALVLGLVSIVLFITVIVPLLAVIFGLVAASGIKKSNGLKTGIKMARAGWILGLLGLAAAIAIIAVAAVEEANDTSTDVDELSVGACYDLPLTDDFTEVSSLEEVPCEEPHLGELYHQYEMNPDRDRSYPGQDETFLEAAQDCAGDPWTDYVGLEYNQSIYEVYVIVPLEFNWKAGRGAASCFLVSADSQELTGSAEDSRR